MYVVMDVDNCIQSASAVCYNQAATLVTPVDVFGEHDDKMIHHDKHEKNATLAT
jgi:hypothetical protein